MLKQSCSHESHIKWLSACAELRVAYPSFAHPFFT
jgi:hypothetical protein